MPKRYGIIFNGTTQAILTVVCNSLIVNNFEWNFSYKEQKFKCRTKINETNIWDDYASDFSIEDFLKQSFIKFTI